MDDFVGSKMLARVYNDMTADLGVSFKEGRRYCLAGKFGIGKTFVAACTLRRVAETCKYSGLYVNLVDIINVMLNSTSNEKVFCRELLMNVDFLVIDEFDSRFMGSDNAADLFGRILEPILRGRIQNRMPLIICTNQARLEDGFNGALQASIESLMNMVKIVSVPGGQDARKKVKEGEL